MKPELLFSDDNADLIRTLQQSFAGCPELTTLILKPHELTALRGLDALYLSIIAAERWRPKLVFYESQILKTRPEDQGWPPYIVVGIALQPGDLRAGSPTEELKLTMKAVLVALNRYNEQNNYPIMRVGFWTDTLWINRMEVSTAGDIIRSAYREQYP